MMPCGHKTQKKIKTNKSTTQHRKLKTMRNTCTDPNENKTNKKNVNSIVSSSCFL